MISTDDYAKSSFSGADGCVEVRLLDDDTVGLRDSKDTSKLPHLFTTAEWRAFVAGVRAGEFDLPEWVIATIHTPDGTSARTSSQSSGLPADGLAPDVTEDISFPPRGTDCANSTPPRPAAYAYAAATVTAPDASGASTLVRALRLIAELTSAILAVSYVFAWTLLYDYSQINADEVGYGPAGLARQALVMGLPFLLLALLIVTVDRFKANLKPAVHIGVLVAIAAAVIVVAVVNTFFPFDDSSTPLRVTYVLELSSFIAALYCFLHWRGARTVPA